MIKKSIHIVIVAILIVATSGLVINKHYSNHQLFDVGIFVEADSCCSVPCDCCDDETIVLFHQYDYLLTSIDVPQDALTDIFLLPCLPNYNFACRQSMQVAIHYTNPPPPNLPSEPLLQVFRC